MNSHAKQYHRNFVVVEPDPVIALDLRGILTSKFPKADLMVFSNATDAEAHLAASSAALNILVNSRSTTHTLLNVLESCAARKSQVVFIGPMADLAFPAVFVQIPFTSEMVLSSLRPKSEEEAE